MEQVHQHAAAHGTTYFAIEQYSGKGQRNRRWLATPGENIILSVVLNTSCLQVSRIFELNFCLALGAYDFLKVYVQKDVSLKWPNDLYWNDRKAGGILVETIIRGSEWQWAIAGFGININQVTFDPSVRNAISLRQITGDTYDVATMAQELCTHLDRRFHQLLQAAPGELLQQYNDVLYRRGERVRLKKDGVLLEGMIRGVNEHGQLRFESETETTFSVGEVEWVSP